MRRERERMLAEAAEGRLVRRVGLSTCVALAVLLLDPSVATSKMPTSMEKCCLRSFSLSPAMSAACVSDMIDSYM